MAKTRILYPDSESSVALDEGTMQAGDNSRLIAEEMKTGSDRACAIVGATALDQCLSDLIAAWFVGSPKDADALLGVERPLGTFGAKIKCAYCLGLLNRPAYLDFELIRRIRNQFAHEITASFDTPKIASQCMQLRHLLPFMKETTKPRERFTGAHYVLLMLTSSNIGHYRRMRELITQGMHHRDLEEWIKTDLAEGKLEFVSEQAAKELGESLSEDNVWDAYNRGFISYKVVPRDPDEPLFREEESDGPVKWVSYRM